MHARAARRWFCLLPSASTHSPTPPCSRVADACRCQSASRALQRRATRTRRRIRHHPDRTFQPKTSASRNHQTGGALVHRVPHHACVHTQAAQWRGVAHAMRAMRMMGLHVGAPTTAPALT
eukprot:3185596-Prymnesium_polylepis.1